MKIKFNTLTSLAGLALVCMAGTAQAAATAPVVPSKIPGCEASFDARFDAATAIVYSSAMRPDTADGALREIWRLTPLCAGEDIIIGDGFHVTGPKASGSSIPSSVTGLVGKTVKLNDSAPATPADKAAHAKTMANAGGYLKSHSKARSNARTSFGNCNVTAYSPQWSGGKVRTGGVTTCSSTSNLSLSVTTNVSAGYDGGGLVFHYNSGASSSVAGWNNWFNCYAVNSYRGYAYSTKLPTGSPAASDVSSYITGAGKGCA